MCSRQNFLAGNLDFAFSVYGEATCKVGLGILDMKTIQPCLKSVNLILNECHTGLQMCQR